MTGFSRFFFFAAFFTVQSFWPCAWASDRTIDRCKKFLPRVIREAKFTFGPEAAYEIFMEQIWHESACKEGATAFDGGKGACQFMDATAMWIQSREPALQEISQKASPYDPAWAVRALVLYDKYLIDRVRCREWYYALRAYNGGLALINREIKRAGTCAREFVELECKRKIITLKSGKKLDMCKDVNIRYGKEIIERAPRWRTP